ncbi:uncharacterized protein LOC144434026 [Glandiceps talaboti]
MASKSRNNSSSSINVTGNSNVVVVTGSKSSVTLGGQIPVDDDSCSKGSCDNSGKKNFRKTFLQISQRCAKDWKVLIRNLPWPSNMDDDELENEIMNICHNHKDDLKEQAYQGLLLWKQRYSDACHGDLMSALQESSLESVADKIADMKI